MTDTSHRADIPQHRQRLRKPHEKPAPVKPMPVKLDLAELRARLKGMSDNEVRRLGREIQRACGSATLPTADDPREELLMQLQEIWLEYRRRFRTETRPGSYTDGKTNE